MTILLKSGMTLKKPTGGKLVMAPTYVGIDDPDAAAYITAVEAADTAAGQSGGLETATKVAIHSFVKGCKADGIWPAIKASCILAGARTLNGALVPLVGAAPTKNNFVSGDYNRETGLVGDGSTKYLNSNRANNAEPQNNSHLSIYVSSVASASSYYAGTDFGGSGGHNTIDFIGTATRTRSRSANVYSIPTSSALTGFIGSSRVVSTSYSVRAAGSTNTASEASQTPNSGNIFVFSRLNGASPTNARLAFYSIGESLDLALLETRVTTLMSALTAAIP